MRYKYKNYIIDVSDTNRASKKEIKDKILKIIDSIEKPEELKYQLFVKLSEDAEEDMNFFGKFDTIEHAKKEATKDDSIIDWEIRDLNNEIIESSKKEIKDGIQTTVKFSKEFVKDKNEFEEDCKAFNVQIINESDKYYYVKGDSDNLIELGLLYGKK